MSYIDKNYVLDSIDQTVLNKLTGGVDARLDQKISAADSLIDSALRAQSKEVPLLSPPEIIKQMSLYLTLYFLYGRVPVNEIPQSIKDNYDVANNFINQLKTGKINVVPDISEENVESSVISGGFEPVMSRKFP